MSLMIPDHLPSASGSTESNTKEFGSQTQTGTSGPHFVEVMAMLQPGVGEDSSGSGQALAALASQAGAVGWAPALTVMPLGEHLQLITPGTEQGAEASLEDFARAQGLDELTIGWLMGQTGSLPTTPHGDGLGASTAAASPGLSIIGGAHAGGLTGNLAASGMPASALSALTPTESSRPPGLAFSVSGLLPADAYGLNAADQEALTDMQAPGSAPGKSASGLVAQGLPGLSAAALWAPVDLQRTVDARTGASAQQPAAEPTESLMATLRSPAATVLTALQRQLQNVSGPNLPSHKTAANLRVSDLDLSQSLAAEGLELQNLLDDWSARLDGPSAGESHQNSALAAARGTGVMANSPLGIAPHGSTPQLGIDLADKFEQLAEKMGQAVAQRMLSEIEKGHWHLKLMLRPATLGHIEVEMRMRSGELDASFVASQNLTRELLQESLPRLRETLTQLGMDVANMNVDSGRSQQGDGDPTPRASAAQTRTETPSGSAQMSTITPSHQERRGQEGWDVMV